MPTRPFRSAVVVALLATTLAAGCGAAPPAQRSKRSSMTANPFRDCKPVSASLNLMGEQVMTRVGVTAQTIDDYAPAVRLKAGDAKLAALVQALGAATLAPDPLPRFEPRTMVRVTCEGGAEHVLLASATQQDGTLHLSIDGTPALTRDPLRAQLERAAD